MWSSLSNPLTSSACKSQAKNILLTGFDCDQGYQANRILRHLLFPRKAIILIALNSPSKGPHLRVREAGIEKSYAFCRRNIVLRRRSHHNKLCLRHLWLYQKQELHSHGFALLVVICQHVGYYRCHFLFFRKTRSSHLSRQPDATKTFLVTRCARLQRLIRHTLSLSPSRSPAEDV